MTVKLKSHVSEGEIYDYFEKVYRQYKALHQQGVGDYFFKETEDLIDKLCDDFEKQVLGDRAFTFPPAARNLFSFLQSTHCDAKIKDM